MDCAVVDDFHDGCRSLVSGYNKVLRFQKFATCPKTSWMTIEMHLGIVIQYGYYP